MLAFASFPVLQLSNISRDDEDGFHAMKKCETFKRYFLGLHFVWQLLEEDPFACTFFLRKSLGVVELPLHLLQLDDPLRRLAQISGLCYNLIP